MPIPPLDSDGFLPPGIFDCTLEEIKSRFGGFQQSDRRPRLFARFEVFVTEAKAAQLITSLIVDGSFVTGDPQPNDIDLIAVVPPQHRFNADLSPSEYAVLSKRSVHRRHGFDLLVAPAGSDDHKRYLDFFQQIRFEPGRSKGILEIRL